MKKTLSSCNECGENKSILTQVSCTVEVIYLCSDCYKDKYSEEFKDKIQIDYKNFFKIKMKKLLGIFVLGL
jgi:hypothetical protein